MIVEIKEKNRISYELPEKLSPKNVQYYCHETKELEQTQVHKAQLFVENKCIKYDSKEKYYYCLPLKGYNSRTYTMKYNKELYNLWQGSKASQ